MGLKHRLRNLGVVLLNTDIVSTAQVVHSQLLAFSVRWTSENETSLDSVPVASVF